MVTYLILVIVGLGLIAWSSNRLFISLCTFHWEPLDNFDILGLELTLHGFRSNYVKNGFLRRLESPRVHLKLRHAHAAAERTIRWRAKNGFGWGIFALVLFVEHILKPYITIIEHLWRAASGRKKFEGEYEASPRIRTRLQHAEYFLIIASKNLESLRWRPIASLVEWCARGVPSGGNVNIFLRGIFLGAEPWVLALLGRRFQESCFDHEMCHVAQEEAAQFLAEGKTMSCWKRVFAVEFPAHFLGSPLYPIFMMFIVGWPFVVSYLAGKSYSIPEPWFWFQVTQR